MTTEGPPLVVYLVRSFPRLSQTFVLDEMLRLERLGVHIQLFVLETSGEKLVHGDVSRLQTRAAVLARASVRDHVVLGLSAPHRYLRAAVTVARQVQHEQGYHAGSRRAAFGQAVTLARRLRGLRQIRPVHLHAHFAHDPALVAQLAALLSGLHYSFTAHARDVHQVAPSVLRQRVGAAVAVVACCEANAAVLEALVAGVPGALGAPGKVRHVPHGVDTDTFRPRSSGPAPSGAPPLVLSVGRLVEKKGVVDLLQALARLQTRGVPFRAEVHGDGPLREELAALTERLGLAESVSFLGARTREQLIEAYQRADIFALTPYRTARGDVDGVPNVVLEAMASGLPVVATTAGGVAEAVTSGHDGLLARPRDVEGIAAHLATLLSHPGLRVTMGEAARRTALERFDGWSAAERLLAIFSEVLSIPAAVGEVGHDDSHVTVESGEPGLGCAAHPRGGC